MQFLSIVVALVTLGFALNLSKSRRGDDRYGIVLLLLPLALATPLAGLLSSGLVLIYAYRNAVSAEGLGALEFAVERAADSQYLAHLMALVALGTSLVAVMLVRPRPAPVDARPDEAGPDEEEDDDATPKALSRYGSAVMVTGALVCVVAVATLSEYEDRFVESPLAFVTAFDHRAVSEFSTNRREVEEQQRMGTNTLVVETFRTLVVMVLFLVIFDAFLVGSRSVRFTRAMMIASVVLVLLAAAVSARKVAHHRDRLVTIEERLAAVARARAASRLEEPVEEEPAKTPGVEVVPPPPP